MTKTRHRQSKAETSLSRLFGIEHHGGTFLGGGTKFHCLAEVGSSEGLLAEVLVEQGTGDIEIGILRLQLYGTVHVAQGQFILAAFLVHAATNGINRSIVRPIAEQYIDMLSQVLEDKKRLFELMKGSI